MKKIKKEEAIKEIKKFSLSLVCGDKKYTAKANSIVDALDIIYKESLGFVKTWGIFTLEAGDKKADIRLRPIQIKRIFTMKFAKELFDKRILMALK